MGSVKTLKLSFVIAIINFQTVNGQNYTCEREVCYPEGYDRLKKPQDHFTLYVNFLLSGEQALKDIDVEKMVIRFEPKIAMAWEDFRLRIKDFENEAGRWLDDLVLKKIWAPKIALSNHATRDPSFYDPGHTGENVLPTSISYLQYNAAVKKF